MAIVETLVSVVIVSLLSLIGALTLLSPRFRSHAFMVGLVALAAGTLLGDAFLHLLPEAVEHAGGLEPPLAFSVLAGFFVFFLLEVVFRWGHAHAETTHLHAAETGHKVKPFGWLNLIGDGVHNFVDGTLIAAAFLVDFNLGVATTIAVAAHELPQELGDFAVLVRAGMAPVRALGFNLLSALLAILGALVVLFVPFPDGFLETYGLPLIAGGFVYIAAADLVPELHHHTHQPDGARLLAIIVAGLAIGVAAMALLLGFEA